MSYSKQELIEALIDFRTKNNCYPTRQDFKAKKIKPSKTTFYRVFSSMENAVKQAELYENGELEIEDESKIRSVKTTSKKGGFQCPFCGGYTSEADKYYSSLTIILAMRFTNLLKTNNGQSYVDGIMDCIHAVFGGHNLEMRKALEVAGFLESFEQRHNKMDKNIETSTNAITARNGRMNGR